MTVLVPLLPLFLVIGTAIGLTGIGGVLLLPALVFVAGLSVHDALPPCLASFLFTGAAGSWMQGRHQTFGFPTAVLLISAGAGSAIGLLLSGLVSDSWPIVLIGLLALVSGVTGFAQPPSSGHGDFSAVEAGGLGIPVGLLSAITGTGGPVLLVPILILLRRSPHLIVTLAQFIQLPIAGMGTLVAVVLGYETVVLGLVIGPVLAVGVLIGSLIKPRVSATLLRRGLAVFLLVFGAATLMRVIFGDGFG